MKIYDITVPFSVELPVYPGDPTVQISQVASLAAGDICTVSHLSFGSHTGTHVDPPAHFIAGKATLDQLPLEILIGKARVVDVGEISAIDVATLEAANLAGVERVLFKTRNSQLWQQGAHEFERSFVYLETDAAERLVNLGVKLVGIDYLSIEKFNFDQPTTHYALLSKDVVVVEGLNLAEVAAGDYELICLPMKIKNGDGGPARVVLREL
ncbi:MAG: cyclase family protein [Acidobacteria bacterium]|nr:cyclase family protein [Acidobacteriota bacterium]